MTWGEKDGLVFVGDSDRIRRRSRMFMLNADNASQQPDSSEIAHSKIATATPAIP